MTRRRPVKTAATSMRSPARRQGKLWCLRRSGLTRTLLKQKPAKTTPPRKKQVSKKKDKELTETQKEAAALVKTLSEKGQTLTYYCCHCGAPLKIGAKAPGIQTPAPDAKATSKSLTSPNSSNNTAHKPVLSCNCKVGAGCGI